MKNSQASKVKQYQVINHFCKNFALCPCIVELCKSHFIALDVLSQNVLEKTRYYNKPNFSHGEFSSPINKKKYIKITDLTYSLDYGILEILEL